MKKIELFHTFKETWAWPIFPILGVKQIFSKNLALSYITPHGPLTPYCVLKKNERANSMKTSAQKDGRFHESYKRIRQLSDIDVDKKDKIQYKSA